MKRRGLIFLCLIAVLQTVCAQSLKFVTIPAGTYQVGAKGVLINPLRKTALQAFEMSATEVTNEQFAAFVAATGYVTDAERKHNALVFEPGLAEFRWLEDSTACWRYPNGISRGDISQKMNHPVTSISHADADAYCNWAGYRLPTLDEWEVASRAGANTRYCWGNNREGIRKYGNIWYGRDHTLPDSTDGYMYTSPVASFKPNAWGLYDMYGNVFEFCDGKTVTDKVNSKSVHARGGSWWCSKNSCNYFNSVDIGTQNLHASFSNQGFRVVKAPRQE